MKWVKMLFRLFLLFLRGWIGGNCMEVGKRVEENRGDEERCWKIYMLYCMGWKSLKNKEF